MKRPGKLLVGPAVVLTAVGIAVASAFGATSPPKVDHIGITSGTKAKPGFYIQDNLRFTPYVSTVRSGGTVVIKGDKGAYNEGPHTFALVKKSQLPITAKAINNCAICGKIAQDLGADPNSQAPPAKTFDDGGDGFNKPGDVVFFEKNPAALKISAKKGTTLYYICAIHPWMQGSVKVR
jgi:hypothetical protein